MPGAKENPKRWYLGMLFCIIMSFAVFMAGPRLGYNPEAIRDVGIWIALLAPSMGLLGVRAELMRK